MTASLLALFEARPDALPQPPPPVPLLSPRTRRLGGGPLGHPRRALIYVYVQRNPGATFREVARQSGTAAGTARHHLSVLKRAGLVVERRHGCTVRFFDNHGQYAATWSHVVLLREEPLRLLHGWIALRGEACQKDVAGAMLAAHGWSRSTTQHRLARLVSGGLVEARMQGRHKFYAVAGAGPGPS